LKIFNKVLDFINKFKKRKNKNEETLYSKFEEFLFFVNENDENYPNIKRAAQLCDKALKIAEKRVNVEKKYKDYSTKLEDVSCYEALNDNEAEYLKELVGKFSSLTQERNTLRYKIGDFPKSINKLEEFQDDVNKIISQMEDAERHEKSLKENLEYLKERKADFEYEHEKLEFGLDFIYKFTIAMVILFASVIVILVILNVFSQETVFFPMTILCILLISLISIIYFFRRKISAELKLNRQVQAKIVTLLNKKIVVYSHYLNFLNYEYKKFNVTSTDMLKANLVDYKNYKNIISRYDSIRSTMFQTQKLLEDFLREKNIKDISASIERFAQTIDVDDKVSYGRELAEKKNKAEKELNELDKKHNSIWEELTKLNIEDKSENKIIEQIIKCYLDEVEKLSDKNYKNAEV